MGYLWRGIDLMTVGRGQQILASFGQIVAAPKLLMWGAADASPYERWVSGSTRTKISDPATIPNSGVAAMAYSADRFTCAVAAGTDGLGNTNVFIYDMTSGGPVLLQQLAPPVGKSWTNISCISLSRDGKQLCINDASNTPFVWQYARSGSTFSLGATQPVGESNGRTGKFNPAADEYMLTGNGSFSAKIYDTTTWTTKTITYTGGAPAVSGACNQAEYSPNGSRIFFNIAGNIYIYNISGTTWTKLTIPTLTGFANQSSINNACGWKPDSSQVILGLNNAVNSRGCIIFDVSGTTVTQDTNNPITANNVRCVQYSADGTSVFFGIQATSSPWIREFSSSTWTALTNPTTQPTANLSAMANGGL